MTTTRTRASCDLVIDAFVGRVNGAPRERLDAESVPEVVRRDGPDGHGLFDWQMVRSDSCPWIVALEETLPRLPPSFRSLVHRYLYPSFLFGNLRLFANTGCQSGTEFATVVLRDEPISKALLASGFLQIGRYRDSYDPVCLDLSRRSGGGEAPLVWIDHESDLARLEVLGQVARSFLALVSG